MTTPIYENKFMVGSDPEFFAVKDGVCVPPFIVREEYGLKQIGGEADEKGYVKHPEYIYGKPVSVEVFGNLKEFKRFVVMEDGADFELTLPPANDPKFMWDNFNAAIKAAKRKLDQFGLETYLRPCARFDTTLFPKYHGTPALNFACRFGCDKDFDIYNGAYSDEIDATKINIRTAGCHIHISTVDLNLHDYYEPFTQLMDITVGQLFIARTNYPEEEANRQKYYGRPGKIRFTTYPGKIRGIEYRTPSITLFNSLDNMKNIFKCVDFILSALKDGKRALDLITSYNSWAVSNIVSFDRHGAETILKSLKLEKEN